MAFAGGSPVRAPRSMAPRPGLHRHKEGNSKLPSHHGTSGNGATRTPDNAQILVRTEVGANVDQETPPRPAAGRILATETTMDDVSSEH